MRRMATVFVALMIVLAGCSGGGGGTATPEETSETTEAETTAPSDTPMDSTPSDDTPTDDTPTDDTPMDDTPDPGDDTDDQDDTQPEASTALSDLSSSGSGSGTFGNATEIDVTLYNGTEQLDLLIQNDTAAGQSLLRLDSSTGGTTTLYQTEDYAALRNTTSGEVQYAGPDGGLGFGVAFAAVFVFAGSAAYAGIVEWEPAGTTADGNYVYETDSLNQTALNQQDDQDQSLTPGLDQDSVQSVDGEMVISSDGKFQSLNVEIETGDGTFGTDMSLNYDPVSVTQPDWVDESQAP